MSDHISKAFSPQLLTTVPKALETTVTTVPSKGVNYEKPESQYRELSDLVNDRFRLWYYHMFHALGYDETMRLAAIARQEAKGDKRRYFSWLLKNPDKR